MSPPSAGSDSIAAAAAAALAQVESKVAAARVVLVRLLQDQLALEQPPDRHPMSQLLEANEEPVVSALRSQTDAATAALALDAALQLAELDVLTHLPNRLLLRDRFERALITAKRHSGRLAVLFLDIDGFKQVNDRLGHAAGDAVLQRMAASLLATVRDGDTVCRYGGDEFVVLLTEVAQAEDAAQVARKLAAALALPAEAGGEPTTLTASIGISIYPDDGLDADTLLGRADAAMYRAKRLGRGGFAWHGQHTGKDRSAAAPPAAASPHAPTAAEQTRHLERLRDANEHLVLAALDAHALQAAAERARRRQIDLLAVVADELRNPQAPIRQALSVLGRAGDDAPLLPQLQALVDHQAAQVAQLLNRRNGSVKADPAATQSAGLALDWQAVDLTGLLQRVVASYRPVMALRGQQLNLLLPTQTLTLASDPHRLAQIVNNLLDNACKHSFDDGQIYLAVRRQGQTVVLTVADAGIGISALALPDVFEPFSQDPQALGLNGVGMGIGLTAVRALVEAHGGSVLARSAGTGRGSEFIVTLPLSQAQPPAPA
jgi:diguanylate cyclase (GGDEF)-like protein